MTGINLPYTDWVGNFDANSQLQEKLIGEIRLSSPTKIEARMKSPEGEKLHKIDYGFGKVFQDGKPWERVMASNSCL